MYTWFTTRPNPACLAAVTRHVYVVYHQTDQIELAWLQWLDMYTWFTTRPNPACKAAVTRHVYVVYHQTQSSLLCCSDYTCIRGLPPGQIRPAKLQWLDMYKLFTTRHNQACLAAVTWHVYVVYHQALSSLLSCSDYTCVRGLPPDPIQPA